MIQKKARNSKKLEQNQKARQEMKLQETLHRKYRKRSYSDTWRPAYIAAKGASFVFNLFSFLTGSFAMGYFLHQAFSFLSPTLAFGVALIIATGLAILIEFLKRNTSGNFFQALIFCKNFKSSYMAGMFLMIGASIGLSFYGSTKIPRSLSTPPLAEAIELEDIAAINNRFNAQIASIETQIESVKANAPRWKGKYNRETNRTINGLNQQIIDLQDGQNAALAQANITNTKLKAEQKTNHDQALKEHEAAEEHRGLMLGYVSLITELLFMLCFLFMETYLDRCALERGMLYDSWENEEDNPVPTATPPYELETEDKIDKSEGHQAPIVKTEKEDSKRIVINGFISRNREDKQLIENDDAQGNRDEEIDTKEDPTLPELQRQIRSTYIHKKKDGSITEMRESDLYDRIKKYRLKIVDLEAKISSGEWTKYTKERYVKSVQWLEYWEAALKQLQANDRKLIQEIA